MADFIIAYHLTENKEGGYSNHPSDRGGETWKGIARKIWPQWGGWKIVDQCKGDQKKMHADKDLQILTEAFYKKNFWDPIMGDSISDQRVANEMYDTGVNMGTGIAVSIVQNALNYMNRNKKLYADLLEDKKMGPGTLSRINGCGEKDLLLFLMNGLQFMRYIQIIENDPSQEEFLRGWMKRVQLRLALD